MKSRFSSVVILAFWTSCTWAAQPAEFNFQAKLTDSNGAPLQGSHTLFFKLSRGSDELTADGGTLLFSEDTSANITNGIVNHAVGTGANKSPSELSASMLRTDSPVFLQVSVDTTNNVVLPRTRLESVPFSIVSADGDARIALEGGEVFPITISASGSYYLTGNITGVATQDGILITTSGVVLDLNGYSLIGKPNSGVGIHMTANLRSIEIRNGIITGGWSDAISAPDTVTDMFVHHIHAVGNRNGIEAGAGAMIEDCASEFNISNTGVIGIKVAESSVVRRCAVYSNSTTAANGACVGIETGLACLVTECVSIRNVAAGSGLSSGIRCSGACRILNNVCRDNSTSGSGTATTSGIDAGSGGEVSGNLCQNNSTNRPNVSVFGIVAGNDCHIFDNACIGNNASGGTRSIGIGVDNRCRVENNHCTAQTLAMNNFGIRVGTSTSSVGNLIIKNTTSTNATAGLRFENSTGSNYYAENIIDETTTVSQNGGSNVAGTGDRSNVAF